MIVCKHCGHHNEDTAQFCANVACGRFLEWEGIRVGDAAASVELAIEPAALKVEPGQEAQATVHVRNTGSIVDEYAVETAGPAAAWTTVEPAVVRLFPGTGGSVRVSFRPPRTTDAGAGRAAFTVRVGSRSRPEVAATASGVLELGSFTQLAASLVPETSRGAGPLEHRVRMRNDSNVPLTVRLQASDPDQSLVLDVWPNEVRLAAGQAAEVALRVTPRQPLTPAASPESRRFEVALEVAGAAPVRLSGTAVFSPPPAPVTPAAPPPPVHVPTTGPTPRRRRRWPWVLAVLAVLALLGVLVAMVVPQLSSAVNGVLVGAGGSNAGQGGGGSSSPPTQAAVPDLVAELNSVSPSTGPVKSKFVVTGSVSNAGPGGFGDQIQVVVTVQDPSGRQTEVTSRSLNGLADGSRQSATGSFTPTCAGLHTAQVSVRSGTADKSAGNNSAERSFKVTGLPPCA